MLCAALVLGTRVTRVLSMYSVFFCNYSWGNIGHEHAFVSQAGDWHWHGPDASAYRFVGTRTQTCPILLTSLSMWGALEPWPNTELVSRCPDKARTFFADQSVPAAALIAVPWDNSCQMWCSVLNNGKPYQQPLETIALLKRTVTEDTSSSASGLVFIDLDLDEYEIGGVFLFQPPSDVTYASWMSSDWRHHPLFALGHNDLYYGKQRGGFNPFCTRTLPDK